MKFLAQFLSTSNEHVKIRIIVRIHIVHRTDRHQTVTDQLWTIDFDVFVDSEELVGFHAVLLSS